MEQYRLKKIEGKNVSEQLTVDVDYSLITRALSLESPKRYKKINSVQLTSIKGKHESLIPFLRSRGLQSDIDILVPVGEEVWPHVSFEEKAITTRDFKTIYDLHDFVHEASHCITGVGA